MIYHYFIVTPLQYLNALEYRLSRKDNSNHYLHIITDHKNRLEIIKQTVHEEMWSEIIYEFPTFVNRRKLFSYISELFRRKRSLKKIKDYSFHDKNENVQFVLGSLTNTYCKFMYQSKIKSVILDDGLATLLIPEKIEKAVFIPKKLNRFLETLIFNQFYFRYNVVTLFSVYSVKHKRIKLENHSFNQLSNLYSIKNKLKTNSVVFIGQPLVEFNLLTKEAYNKYVNAIKKSYEKKGYSFFYHIHPAENKSLKDKNWKVESQKVPLEIHFLIQKEIPEIFASFYSSAIINLYLLFENYCTYEYWQLDSKTLKKRYNTDIYKILKDQKLNFYELNKMEEQ